MKAKKLLAALGVLVLVAPGVALAEDLKATKEVIQGHTVFAAVEELNKIEFAAIAGSAAKKTVVGGVLWFNNQELIPDITTKELAAGNWILATEAGNDDPREHFPGVDTTAKYVESYQLMDPNNRAWLVDRYDYEECSVAAGGDFHEVPCEAKAANNQDPAGIEEASTGEVVRTSKSYFVVGIDATTPDCNGSGKDYNFVTLVRLDTLYSTVVDGGYGEHTGHTHPTAQVDLWFSESRPADPTARSMLFTDAVSGGALLC